MLLNKRGAASKRLINETGLPWNKKMAVNKLGIETESEIQLKELLEKQLCTNYTLKDHLDRIKDFANAGTFTSIPAGMTGTRSTKEIENLQKLHERTLHLKCCGLTDDEIHFYYSSTRLRNGHMTADPNITRQTLKAIEDKLTLYEASQVDPKSGSGLKRLGRHQMDLERSLYQGCAGKESLKQLVGLQTVAAEEPFRFVAQMADRLALPLRKNKVELEAKEFVKPDPSVWHAVVPLDPQEIIKNRSTTAEIKSMARFKNYEEGVPSRVLYVKNLHPKANVEDLIALFGRFDPVTYRLLSGRLRGQAFATFQDSKTAEAALRLVNGYSLRGRPIILEFGKSGFIVV